MLHCSAHTARRSRSDCRLSEERTPWSGSFNEIDVPPTLVSFAVDVAKEGDIITPEFKKAGNPVYLFTMEKDAYDLPVYAQVMKLYDTVHTLIQSGAVAAAYALDGKGIALALSKDGHSETSLA